jgi:acylphosphatase
LKKPAFAARYWPRGDRPADDELVWPTYHMWVFETQHLLVKGRVQGVSFRFFTKTQAETYGIFGWVRNLTDGRVEALIQGPSSELERLLQVLKEGPSRASVEEIVLRNVEFDKRFTEFSILEDSEEPWAD